jgi:hypothetical protein
MKRIVYLLALLMLASLSACALPALNSPQPTAPPSPTLTQPPVSGGALIPRPTTPSTTNPVPPTQPTQPPLPLQVYLPGVETAPNQPSVAYPPPAPEPTLPPPPTLTPTTSPTPPPGDITRLDPYSPHTGEKLPYTDWRNWPVLPAVSQRAIDIYQKGIAAGNDPKHFSKIGDCQVIRQYFLGYFDNPNYTYHLGDAAYNSLSAVLKNFNGSYFRLSMAVHTGFNVASVLSSINNFDSSCKSSQTPLQCEDSQWNPSIAIISMETWTANRPTTTYERYLRQIVDYELSQNVLPILATKADNLEGDNSINQMIARVAYEYDLPLWNFWAAADPLPSHGLMEDGFHLTNGDSILYGDGLRIGWNTRNLTALQALNQVWNAVKKK